MGHYLSGAVSYAVSYAVHTHTVRSIALFLLLPLSLTCMRCDNLSATEFYATFYSMLTLHKYFCLATVLSNVELLPLANIVGINVQRLVIELLYI